MTQGQGVISLQLMRDGPVTAWGFRLSGGADVGAPLVIQRVFLGSPSEGELQRGDIILKIRDKDANRLSHKEASDLIMSSGNKMSLQVLRSGSGGRSPSGSPSPVSFPIMNATGPVTVYHFTTSTQSTPTPYTPPTYPTGSERLFQPLPTTHFQDGLPMSADAIYAQQTWVDPKTREKLSIANQAYRTLPLIGPQAKPNQDTPIGSYLRFVTDPCARPAASPAAIPVKVTEQPRKFDDALMRTKVQETVLTAASNSPRASMSPGRTPTPDSALGGPKVVPLQYNSPFNLYSAQNVAEAISSQTGSQPAHLRDALREVILNVATCISSPMVNDQSSPHMKCQSPPLDISKSPTYQLIHQTEKDIQLKELKEHRPADMRVYDFATIQAKGLNTHGIPQSKIHQSGSFKTLMTSLSGVTEF